MAGLNISVAPPSEQNPLLGSSQAHQTQEEDEATYTETRFNQNIDRLQTFLSLMGFQPYSRLTLVCSWMAFVIGGFALPMVVCKLPCCPTCTKYHITWVECPVLVLQALLAFFSLLFISINFGNQPLRDFLYVNPRRTQIARCRKEYSKKIKHFYCLLFWWTLPCVCAKIFLEIRRNVDMCPSWWTAIAMILASVISWTYLTTISLSACLLFNLVCNMEMIQFDDYENLLESNIEVVEFIEVHMTLKNHLKDISHRFRGYLIFQFLLVTVSLLFSLFKFTGDHRTMNVTDGGSFIVISIAQVVGMFISIHAAAKFSHRAQNIASVASRWHALVTCGGTFTSQSRVTSSVREVEDARPVGSVSATVSGIDSVPPQTRATSSVGNREAAMPVVPVSATTVSEIESVPPQSRASSSVGNPEAATPMGSVSANVSESDLKSLETLMTSSNAHISAYHKRQSLVMYLQSNVGGVTVYGWTIDRLLIDTVFITELSLIMFVLGKTLSF